MRPYGGFESEDELLVAGFLLVDFFAELDEGFLGTEDELEGLDDADAEGVLFAYEYAGTSDSEPALAAASTFAGTDWSFCCAALT